MAIKSFDLLKIEGVQELIIEVMEKEKDMYMFKYFIELLKDMESVYHNKYVNEYERYIDLKLDTKFFKSYFNEYLDYEFEKMPLATKRRIYKIIKLANEHGSKMKKAEEKIPANVIYQ